MFMFVGSLLVFYVGALVYYVRKFVEDFEEQMDQRINDVRHIYQLALDKKEDLYVEKMGLEGEALKIFTLYEITRDITSSLNEQDAFKLFKDKLAENIIFEDIRYFSEGDQGVDVFKQSKEYLTLPLHGKKEHLGYLTAKGINEEDQEKFTIMANQFALALRRVKLYAEIEKIAITDSLTELYTRHYLMERFQEELRRSKLHNIHLAFLMIDVDFFKKFNDQFGHLTGDQILRAIGVVIKENIREIDIAGRYGGEEFCVVLPDTSRDGAQYVAERIRLEMEKRAIKAYDTTHKVTISIGIATFPSDGKSVEELIDKSDWALYRAKKKGRNCICTFGVYQD